MSQWICKECGTRGESHECPACGSNHMVPVETPVGQELVQKYRPMAPPPPTSAGGTSKAAIGLAVLVGGLIGLILLVALVLVLYFAGVFNKGADMPSPPAGQTAASTAGTAPAADPVMEETSAQTPAQPPPQQTQARSAPPKPKVQPSIVTTKARELTKEAEEALTLAEHHQFGPAFQRYDTFDSRVAQLDIKANSADRWSVDKAKKQVAYSKTEMQRIAGEWARPKYDEGLATYLHAVDGLDDEEGIILAYVTIAPALQYKKYLPSDVRRDLNSLSYQCQENLDDDEWARAQALGRARQN